MYAKKRVTAKKYNNGNKRVKRKLTYGRTRNAKRTGGFYINNLMYGKELKTLDRSNAASSPGVYNIIYASNAPDEIVLNNLNVGSGFNQRIGNKVRGISLHVRARITMVNGANPPSSDVRVIVIYDKQSNSTGPSFNNIYANEFAITMCYMDPSFFERYVTIIDKRYSMVLTADNNTICVDEYRTLSKDTMYTGSGGTGFANIASGGLCLFFVSDDTPAVSTGATRFEVRYNTRFRYLDI